MDFNSNDYFTYKRNKIQKEIPQRQKKRISKLNFLFQLFIATFIIVVAVTLFVIMKFSPFSAKVDIEYTRGGVSQLENNTSAIITEDVAEVEQGKIDKRLILIQQEEKAPYEAKIITQNKQNNVMDPKLIEDNEKIDKTHLAEFKHKQQLKQQEKEKQQKQAILPLKKLQSQENNQETKTKETKTQDSDNQSKTDLKHSKTTAQNPQNPTQEHSALNAQNSNLIIMSKVFIGRYRTLDDAQAMQNTIKTANPNLTPYVKKVGNVFSIQMGSYQDFAVARKYAQKLKAKGYEVWIYQQ